MQTSRMRIRVLYLIFFVIMLLFTACDGIQTSDVIEDGSDVEIQSVSRNEFEEAHVIEVVDGDTVWVESNGYKNKVRMIGLNAPEIAHDEKPADKLGDESHEFSKTNLLDKTVYLESDVNDTDKYGRLLRYIWLEVPKEPVTLEQAQESLYNYILIYQGYARQKTYGEDDKYEDFLKDAAEKAIKR